MDEAGLWPTSDAPPLGSFWSGVDVGYRLPVWIAYLALVAWTTFWPAEKNLGELIATSAALLVASQFWYLSAGGTLVLLYLPLVILMMFRPNPRSPVHDYPEAETASRGEADRHRRLRSCRVGSAHRPGVDRRPVGWAPPTVRR